MIEIITPKHWEAKKLSEIAIFFQGYGFPKNLQGIKIGEYPFYKVGDISKNVKAGNRYLELCDNYLDKKTLDKLKAKPYPKNTIVFAKIGEGLKLNRRAIINIPGVVDNNAIGLKAKEKLCNDLFLFYFLTTVKLEDYSKATTVPSVRKSEIEEILIPLPPLPEQQAIVSKIEELLSDLENGKQQLLTAQQQLKVYRQSLLKWAFEGKLTNKNVKDGELPESWKKIQVKDVANTIGGYAFKSGEFLNEGKYQVLRMGNVRPGIIRYNESPVFLNNVDESVLNRACLQLNDIIITQTGTRKKRDYGFTALIQKSNLLLNQRIASIRFNESFLPKFFLYFTWTDFFKDQFFANETGNVGQGNVGMKAITETLIPYCSLEEQQLIVDILESKLTVCDKIEETITNSLLQAESLMQSILKKAFEGRLNFDLSDLYDEHEVKMAAEPQIPYNKQS